MSVYIIYFFFFFQAEDGIRDSSVTGVQTCALPILRPDLRHDASNLLNAAGSRIDVCRTQLGRQQITAADDVQRQIAVAIIVAVEESPFLMPGERIVRGVEVKRHLGRPPLMRHPASR